MPQTLERRATNLLPVSHRGLTVISVRNSLRVEAGMPVSFEIAAMLRPDASSCSMISFHMGPNLRLAESVCQRLSESFSDYRAPMSFAERVKARRNELGFSQAALARAAGLSPPTINEIESGKNMTSRHLPALARALRCNPLYLTDGKLPKESDSGTIIPAMLDRASGEISIPQLDVQGSMGHGSIPPDHIDVVRNVIVNRKELEKQCSFTAPQNLQIITGYGRSMQPTFCDGDPLLVDTGVTSVNIEAVYVFELEGELFIKGIQRLPGGRLRVISHNREENDPWDLTPEQVSTLQIRGRVVMAWNARRL